LAFESTSGASLFNAKSFKEMCYLEEDIVQKNSLFQTYCLKDTNGNCCSSYSLGNMVASVMRKSSCQDITDSDVNQASTLIESCAPYFVKGLLKNTCSCNTLINGTTVNNCPAVPCLCFQDQATLLVMNYLTDNKFLLTPKDKFLKYALSFLPLSWWDNDFYKDVYDSKLKKSLPNHGGVKVVGFDFGNYKYDLFSTLLIDNAKYPAIAMVVLLIIMCLYLNSIIIAFCGLLSIIFALVDAYFIYKIVLGINFFPFLNVVTLVFLVGIGADDAFVYYDIWRQTKKAHPNEDCLTLTWKTLRYAALSMLVTSMTTSAAFFASVSSKITSIKCFGIFAGISILTCYLMMITWFPAVVLLHERWIRRRTIDQMPKAEPTVQSIRDGEQEASAVKPTKWLPNAVLKKRLYFLWIVIFIGLTIGFICVIFVSPKISLPSSKDFQVFASSSTLEQYEMNVKNNIRYAQGQGWGLWVKLIWGVKPEDNGHHLNPDDLGTLTYENNFDPFAPESQKWMLSLSKNLRNQTFFSKTKNYYPKTPFEMFLDHAIQESCLENYTFPYPRAVFENCYKKLDFYNKYVLYDENGKPRAVSWGFATDFSYTSAFKPMDDFWNEINSWSTKEMAKAPKGLQNGWAVCESLDFYSLQASLSAGTFSSMSISVAIAFVVMLLTTLNIFISLYAIITIVGILAITVGSLVLLGWQLNILESIVMSVAVGLSIDFTMHYGVAYRLSPYKDRRDIRVRYSFVHIGSAIFMAALTTFITGLLMMPAIVLVYNQLGVFLMLVMFFSYIYATLAFQSMCALIGPINNFGQLSISR
ncbi:predicted protein, partial [Nematostella vectensis]